MKTPEALEHVGYECQPGCDKPYCMFCVGGLFTCIVCKGFEGTLPTDCPGRKLSEKEADDIYAGKLDYRSGQWIERSNRSAPSASDITAAVDSERT